MEEIIRKYHLEAQILICSRALLNLCMVMQRKREDRENGIDETDFTGKLFLNTERQA